jgi:hypothetical protein
MMPQRRSIKLILPSLQLRLIVAFLSLAAITLLLQYLLVMRALAQVATELPHDGNLLVDSMGSILTQIFLISATVILPITFVVGMLATHRLAGPLYRFKMYLNSVVRGEKPADCKLRRGDELQDLCELINLATAETRKVSSASAAEQSSAKPSNLRAAG